MLEKGNADMIKIQADCDSLEKALMKVVNTAKLELKTGTTTIDNKVDNVFNMLSGKLDAVLDRMDSFEAGEVLREFTVEKVETESKELKKMISVSKRKTD